MARRTAILFRVFAAVTLVSAADAPALAQDDTATVATPPDGRLYGHIPYAETDPAQLVDAPKGFAVGQACEVQPAMTADLTALLAAEHGAHLGADLRGVSCFRTIDHQQRIFCDKSRPKAPCIDPADRAESVAPPGHSEHATGYAIDFGTRPEGHCADVENCFADTPAGKWLILNAPDYGFELSFPNGNAQGVTWEPWHWRWVGTSNSEPGALTARALFEQARTNYPANPRIPTIIVRVLSQPPLPTPHLEVPDLGEAPASADTPQN